VASSGGGGIVESATAPTGVDGLVWRNEGVHKVFLDAAWRDLTYYNGDKAQVHIDMDSLSSDKVQYLSADLLSMVDDSYLSGFCGLLTHPLQRGGYVEVVMSYPSARAMRHYLGLRAVNSEIGRMYYYIEDEKVYCGASSVSYGSPNTADTSRILGVSRDMEDNVRFYRDGVDLGIVGPAITQGLAGWFPFVDAPSSTSAPYSYAWHVDESTIQYLPDGFQPINEQ
jgi:hypothetical protein